MMKNQQMTILKANCITGSLSGRQSTQIISDTFFQKQKHKPNQQPQKPAKNI